MILSLKKKESVVNLALFNQLESQGKEVKRTYNKKNIIIAARIESPIKQLREKQIISHEQYSSGIRYIQDYARANISHHARPSYGIPAGGGKDEGMSDEQLQSAKIVREIKTLLVHKDIEYQRARERLAKLRRQSKPIRRSKKYLLVTKCVLEREWSLRKTSLMASIRRDKVGILHTRIIEILNIMTAYYDSQKISCIKNRPILS